MRLRREVSVADDVNYHMFMMALDKLYVPTVYFQKNSRDSGIYIELKTDPKKLYFSFHTDIGRPNKIHYNYIDSKNNTQTIELKIDRDDSKAIAVMKKSDETKELTIEEINELRNIRQFFIYIEDIIGIIKIPMQETIENLEYELWWCNRDRNRDRDRGGYGYSYKDRYKNSYTDGDRDRDGDRDGYDMNRKKYIKYKKKYLKLKKKFEEKN